MCRTQNSLNIEDHTDSMLVVDFRTDQSKPSFGESVANTKLRVLSGTNRSGAARTIEKDRPAVICFEFDFPELSGLKTLLEIRKALPHICIVMVTAYHSEALAVWAFRLRVSDYFVSPVIPQEVFQRMRNLAAGVCDDTCFSTASIPKEVRWRATNVKPRTQHAINYIAVNYAEKIKLSTVAQMCCLSPPRFSAIFRQEHGVTFQEFVVHHRISKARELLAAPGVSITDVTFMVGFNDVSYFSRTFARITGLIPSKFQKEAQEKEHYRDGQ